MAAPHKLLKAKPSLRGLRITSTKAASLVGTTIPWKALRRHNSDSIQQFWSTRSDEPRQPVEEQYRCTLIVRGWRACRIAGRAHHRAFKQAWCSGECRAMHTPKQRGQAGVGLHLMVCAGAAGIIALATWFIASQLGDAVRFVNEASPENRPLAITEFTCWISLPLLPAMSILVMTWLHFRTFNVVEAELDHRGMKARLRDGSEWTQPWNELKAIEYSFLYIAKLKFHAGPDLELWLAETPDTRSLLKLAEEAQLPEASARRKRRERSAQIRCVGYLVAGVGLLIWILNRLEPNQPGIRDTALGNLTGLSIVVAAITCGPRLVAYMWNRVRRKWALHRAPALTVG